MAGPVIETDSHHQPIVVEDLDADWLLALCADAEPESRRAERRRLRYALHWCHLHPADPDQVAKGYVEHAGGEGTAVGRGVHRRPARRRVPATSQAARELMSDALDLPSRLRSVRAHRRPSRSRPGADAGSPRPPPG